MFRPAIANVSAALAMVFLLVSASPAKAAEGPVKVEVVKTDPGFELRRDGRKYVIQGVGGTTRLDLLAQVGGNSVRTWGVDKVGQLLDECQRLGLTATVGIWLGHTRHGFNYADPGQVARQLEAARRAVLQHKDHPALLMWGVGNEMEGYEAGDDPKMWAAVNDVAAMIKKLDPNHPTMSVVAEIGGQRVRCLHELCPAVDVVGVNAYGGAATLIERYRKAGGQKPLVVTEYGPPGVWETNKTPWGAAPEPTSTAKAAIYGRVYQKTVVESQGLCLGSYAFLWGRKQEATATWFGMLLPTGERLAAVDELQTLWTGSPPKNRCPRILELSAAGDVKQKPAARLEVRLKADDPEGDPLQVEWVLQAEPKTLGVGGDDEQAPAVFHEALVEASADKVVLQMPLGGGGYRLFAYVRDDHHGAATANLPLFVESSDEAPKSPQAVLPLVVYDEHDAKQPPYAATGWMGETKSLRVTPDFAEAPHAGKTCMKIDYLAPDGWAGVVWQSPANDWGDRPGGWNLTGAKKLTFWAKGSQGGEKVAFQFGLLGPDKKFGDTGRGKREATLKTEWTSYTIDLSGQDLSRIKTGFGFTVAPGGKPCTFFVDSVRFE